MKGVPITRNLLFLSLILAPCTLLTVQPAVAAHPVTIGQVVPLSDPVARGD